MGRSLLSIVISAPSPVVASTGDHRYWKVSFTTAFGASSDYMVGQIALKEYDGGPDYALYSSLSQSGGLNEGPLVGVLSMADSSGVFFYFDNTRGTAPFEHVFDLRDVTATITRVELTAGSVGGEMPRDFEVYYSDDGSTWTLAWEETGTTAYANYENKVYTHPSETSPIQGMVVTAGELSALIGQPPSGVSTQQAELSAIVGKRPDGPTIEDATVYLVIDP